MEVLKIKEKRQTILGKNLTGEQIEIVQEKHGAWAAFYRCQKHFPESWKELYCHLYVARCPPCKSKDQEFEAGKSRPQCLEEDYKLIMQVMEKWVKHNPEPDRPTIQVRIKGGIYKFSPREMLWEMQMNTQIGLMSKKALINFAFSALEFAFTALNVS